MSMSAVCPFCVGTKLSVLAENDFAYAIYDKNPVTALHSLVIPKRHISSFFALTGEELLACYDLLTTLKENILKEDISVTAFNVGVNIGKMAGQTIDHCHIHLIPRRDGDVENPRGGIRHLIPGKGLY